MNKITATATFLVAIIIATAATWFVFNQIDYFNQINKVQITAFSIDPKGWENRSGIMLNCSFNMTIQNLGINDLRELKLVVKMFINDSEIHVKSNIFGINEGWINDTFSPREIRTFHGELQYNLPSEGAIDIIGGHPVGASYMAQVLWGNDILDEAELAGLFSFELTDTIILERYGGYYGVAYDSAKGEIYFTNGDFHLVYVISDSTNEVVATIPVGYTPSGIAYDSGKGEIFVTNYGSDSVSVISTINHAVVATIPVGHKPMGIAYDSGKGEIFVTNYGSDTVSVISDSSFAVVATIPVGNQPSALAYDSSKGEIFVGHAGSNQVLVISDSNNAIVANITVEKQPIRLIYDSGKGEIFVANHGSDSVSVISNSDYAVVATIPVGSQPNAMDYDSVNGHIFVANYNSNSISVISDSNYAVIANIPLERQPQAIGYNSDKKKIFVAYSESQRVSVISVLSLPPPLPSDPEYP